MNMIFKRLGKICFAFGFLFAIFAFTNYGIGFIPKHIAKTVMLIFGALAILMNLISLRFDPDSDQNLLYWIGVVFVFCGLIMQMKFIPYAVVFILAGVFLIGFSLIYNPFSKKKRQEDDEILDR